MEPARKIPQAERQPLPLEQDRPTLAEALAEIAAEARVDPQDYLEQTRTPGGGE